jgi:hypothetical protein
VNLLFVQVRRKIGAAEFHLIIGWTVNLCDRTPKSVFLHYRNDFTDMEEHTSAVTFPFDRHHPRTSRLM